MTYEQQQDLDFYDRQQDEIAEAAYYADLQRHEEETLIALGRYQRAVETAVLERDRLSQEFGITL